MVSGGFMTATYQTNGEYYTREGLLVREGVTIPKGAENDPFYSAANIHYLNESIDQMNKGKTITKSFEELEKLAK
jgi:hypothetical protein